MRRDPALHVRHGDREQLPDDQGGSVRVDEMEKCGHYERWRDDFDCRRGAGHPLPALRPAAAHAPGSAPDATTGTSPTRPSPSCTARDIMPIVDLCHFGVPDWIGNFQNPDFPELSPTTPSAFARRFPWVQLYTPGQRDVHLRHVLGALRLVERAAHDRPAFVTALKHLVKANVLAMQAILEVRPDAIFIQSESSEYFHAENPGAIKPAEIDEREALPVARPQLRPARRLGDVRVPAGQRHDAGGVPLLPRQQRSSTTASWATTTTSPTSTASSPTAARARRARSSATTRSPGSTTTATACR